MSPAADAPAGPRDGGILIIFGSRAAREGFPAFETGAACPVEVVEGRQAALAAAEGRAPDALVVVAAPGVGAARELLQALRARPWGPLTPAAVLAERFSPAEREGLWLAGADACLELAAGRGELLAQLGSLVRAGRARRALLAEKQTAEGRAQALARANAEAARLILDVEERDRRIQEQQKELAEQNKSLARANAEAGRLILEVEEKDRRLQTQSEEIERHLAALRRDLAIAADLQINLLPIEYPNARELRLFDRFLFANELCGDYYDYILHPDGDFDVVVADVTGHGVASALVSVQIRAIARARAPFEKSPARTLRHLNEFMVANFRRQFLMTMFYLGWRAGGDGGPGKLVYAGAGHTPPLLLRAGGRLEELRSQGLPLGVEFAEQYAENAVELAPGDRLLIYTDGLVEVYDGSRRQWGLEGLKATLSDCRKLAGREVIDHLLREARYFSGQRPFDDDVTVVLVERSAEEGG